jgi:T4-like virus tail tube protein gp19
MAVINKTEFNINSLKSTLTGGGARTNLFSVTINAPQSGLSTFGANQIKNTSFLVQASKLPEVTMGTIEVPYMGRKLRLPGDRSFPAWNVTVINDEDFMVRNAMEEWTSKINGIQSNLRDGSMPTIDSLKGTATVTQYTKQGGEARTYLFTGIFPSEISPIELDWNQNDQIEYFGVTFSYDYWTTSTTGTGGSRGGAGQ